jgi:lipopolysaccharide export system protein LptC
MRLALRSTPLPAAAGEELPVPAGPLGGAGAGSWSGGFEDRYSRRVALLKRLLPATGIALLLLIAVWPRLAPLWERFRLSLPAIDLRDARELQMVNPRYAGVDREGRPYVVTSAAGRQIPDRQDLMSLQRPRADLKTQGGAEIVVTAFSGIYQSQAQLLDLFGDVTVVHQNGTRFLTQTARLNAATNTAQGGDPVVGKGPSGELKAQGFQILEQGERVLFTGRSELVGTAAKAPATHSAPAGLPTPIAAAAAMAEAEAKPLLAGASAVPPARPKPVSRAAAPAAKPPAGTKRTASKSR